MWALYYFYTNNLWSPQRSPPPHITTLRQAMMPPEEFRTFFPEAAGGTAPGAAASLPVQLVSPRTALHPRLTSPSYSSELLSAAGGASAALFASTLLLR